MGPGAVRRCKVASTQYLICSLSRLAASASISGAKSRPTTCSRRLLRNSMRQDESRCYVGHRLVSDVSRANTSLTADAYERSTAGALQLPTVHRGASRRRMWDCSLCKDSIGGLQPYAAQRDGLLGGQHAWPSVPTASASRKARSPLPQHTSSAAWPRAAPLHFTAARFHTRCRPRLRTSFSCERTE